MNRYLDDVLALPASRTHVSQVFRWMRAVRLVLAGVRVGVLFLVKVPERVVHFSVLALVGANYYCVSMRQFQMSDRYTYCTKASLA